LWRICKFIWQMSGSIFTNISENRIYWCPPIFFPYREKDLEVTSFIGKRWVALFEFYEHQHQKPPVSKLVKVQLLTKWNEESDVSSSFQFNGLLPKNTRSHYHEVSIGKQGRIHKLLMSDDISKYNRNLSHPMRGSWVYAWNEASLPMGSWENQTRVISTQIHKTSTKLQSLRVCLVGRHLIPFFVVC
jgi:hypothetical protein